MFVKINADSLNVTVLSDKIESATRVQSLDEVICASLCANTLSKGMNLSVFSPG